MRITFRPDGQDYAVDCSVAITPNPLPANVSNPSFKWFFGPANSSLPSGVTVFDVEKSGNNYTNTLQFSPQIITHIGMFTCRLGGNERLAANTTIYAVRVIDHGIPQLGQNYNLTCIILGTTMVIDSYRWKKNDIYINGSGSVLSFSSLKSSDAAFYTCEVTMNSLVYIGHKEITLEISNGILNLFYHYS